MKTLACSVLVCVLATITAHQHTKPRVQVYSRTPGVYDQANHLICHVSGFNPPQVHLELLKNGVEIPNGVQSDLAFHQSWQYHLTRHVPFTPKEGDVYTCMVTHMTGRKPHIWEPDV